MAKPYLSNVNLIELGILLFEADPLGLDQEWVSELKFYEGLIVNIPSILFAMFAGSWADQRGRKLILALPFAGMLSLLHLVLDPDSIVRSGS